MKQLLNSLIEKNNLQREALIGLLEVLQEEKEVLRRGEPHLLPALLRHLQEISGKAMLAEAERNRAAAKLAETLGCNPVLKEICTALDNESSCRLKESSRNLLSVVVSIKEISFILSRQAEEQRFLSEMILERLKSFVRPGHVTVSLDTRA